VILPRLTAPRTLSSTEVSECARKGLQDLRKAELRAGDWQVQAGLTGRNEAGKFGQVAPSRAERPSEVRAGSL